MNRLLVLAVIGASLGSIRCADEDEITGSEIDTTVIMPLEIGNRWSYGAAYWNLDGDLLKTDVLVIRIVDDTVIDDRQWFIPETDSIALMYANCDDGLWIREDWGLPGLAIKYPATPGESYNSGDSKVHVLSRNYPVTVEAGFFECYRYVQTWPQQNTDSIFQYFAPGIGLVARENRHGTGIGEGKLLERWRLGNVTIR